MNKEMRLSDFSVAVYAGLLDRINPEKRNPILEILNTSAQMSVLLNREWKTKRFKKTTDLEDLIFDSTSKTMKIWTEDQYKEMEIDSAIAVPFEKYDITLEELAMKIKMAFEGDETSNAKDVLLPRQIQVKI